MLEECLGDLYPTAFVSCWPNERLIFFRFDIDSGLDNFPVGEERYHGDSRYGDQD